MYLATIAEEMNTLTRNLDFDVEYGGDRWAVAIEPPRPCLDEDGPVFYPHMLDIRCKTTERPQMDKVYQALSAVQQSIGYRTYGRVIYGVNSMACFIVRCGNGD